MGPHITIWFNYKKLQIRLSMDISWYIIYLSKTVLDIPCSDQLISASYSFRSKRKAKSARDSDNKLGPCALDGPLWWSPGSVEILHQRYVHRKNHQRCIFHCFPNLWHLRNTWIPGDECRPKWLTWGHSNSLRGYHSPYINHMSSIKPSIWRSQKMSHTQVWGELK